MHLAVKKMAITFNMVWSDFTDIAIISELLIKKSRNGVLNILLNYLMLIININGLFLMYINFQSVGLVRFI